MSQVLWFIPVIPAPGRLNQEGCHRFKASPGYIVSSKVTWAIEQDPASIKHTQKIKEGSRSYTCCHLSHFDCLENPRGWEDGQRMSRHGPKSPQRSRSVIQWLRVYLTFWKPCFPFHPKKRVRGPSHRTSRIWHINKNPRSLALCSSSIACSISNPICSCIPLLLP